MSFPAGLALLIPSFVHADTTAQLVPSGNGTYTSWSGDYTDVNEGIAGASCSSGDYVNTNTANQRESFTVSLASIPNGSTITSVQVLAEDRGDSSSGGTYATFVRFNGSNSSNSATHTVSGTSGACTGSRADTFDVADTVKSGATSLEIGVVKINSGGSTNNELRVGAMAVVVTYTPVTYTITSTAGAGGTITPNGATVVTGGSDQSYVIAPAAGYVVAAVSVDAGPSLGLLNSYTFSSVASAHMIDASFDGGWSAPASYSNNNGVGSPANAYSSNDSRATFDSQSDQVDYGTFGLSIPTGATIDGIEVAVEGNRVDPRTLDISLSWDGGSTFTAAKNVGATFSSTDRTVILGGASDTWGRTWAASEFGNGTFRVRADAVTSGPGDTLSVDQIQVRVHYTAGGHIIVQKDTDPDGSAQSFAFTTTGAGYDGFSIADGGSNDQVLPPGTYSVSETGVTGWTQTSAVCVSSTEDAESPASISLQSGETVTCTFTNTKPPTLTLVKHAVGGEGEFQVFRSDGETTVVPPALSTEGGWATTSATVIPGSYTVGEYGQGGWDLSAVACTINGVAAGSAGIPGENQYGVTSLALANGDDAVCTFTNEKRGSLTVTKISDPAEGEFEFSIAGIGDTSEQEPFIPSTHTFAPAGTWGPLTNLLPGDYHLAETVLAPEGWSGSQLIACTGGGSQTGSVGGEGFDFEIAPGAAVLCTVNNTQNAVISGTKYEDMKADGPSEDDVGLSGWHITATRLNDDPATVADESVTHPVFEATTGTGGTYSMTLVPGAYAVCETAQEGWHQSYPVADDGIVECGDDTRGYDITIGAGSNTTGYDFGNYKNGSIAGFKWLDADADGILDGEEEGGGLSGWTIDLIDGSLSTIASAVTVGGVFSFAGVKPGTYTLQEQMQSGWVQTYPGDSVHTVMLLSNGSIVNKNFGNVHDATISGSKWKDENGNGVWDEGEHGLSGWQIYVDIDEDGMLGADEPFAMTAGDGSYTIAGLLPGTYQVREVSHTNWYQTYPSETAYHEVTLGIDQDATGVDFGNAPTKTLTGSKWNDADRNHLWGEESGIEGWTITAMPVDSEGNPSVTHGTTKTATTDEGGDYSIDFNPTEYGWWRISEVQETGWAQTYPYGESDSYLVLITSSSCGEDLSGFDFGNWQEPAITVTKWNDQDNDGTWDEGEPAIEGWSFALAQLGEGSEEGTDAWIVTTGETDEDGVATLYAPQPGSYAVIEQGRSNWTRTFPADSDVPLNLIATEAFPGVEDYDGDSYYYVYASETSPKEVTTESSEGAAPLIFGNHETPAPAGGGSTPPVGGNGPIAGSFGTGFVGGTVLGAATSTQGQTGEGHGAACSAYITSYMRRGAANDPEQVRRLQEVLTADGEAVAVTGVFDVATENAVKAFQRKYASRILAPWGLTQPTGYVYLTTRKVLNEVHCSGQAFPLSREEQRQVDSFRTAGQGGSTNPSSPAGGSTPPAPKQVSTTTDEQGTTTPPQSQAGAAGTTGSTTGSTGGGFWGFLRGLFGR